MYKIVPFHIENEKIWDEFVMHQSINGTFLHTRRFLNYHPKDRFQDCSVLLYCDEELAAVCPANVVEENGRKTFFSHKGSTYGGLVIAKKYYKAKYVLPMVEELKAYLQSGGYDELYLKLTPRIFSQSDSLLEYACYYNGFSEYKELNPYIEYENYAEPVIKNFSQGKRTHVHKCEREGIQVKTLCTDAEIGEYTRTILIHMMKFCVKICRNTN